MKRLVSFLLIFTLCLGLLCACGRAGENVSWSWGENEQRIIKQSFYPFDPGYTIRGIAQQGDILMVAAARDENKSLKLFEIDGGITEIPCAMTLDNLQAPDKEEIKAVAAAPDGRFGVLTGEFGKQYYNRQMKLVENPDYQGRFSVLCYDTEGQLLSEARFSLSFDDARGLCYDDGGTAYVYGKSYITAIGEEGKTVAELEFVPDFELYSAAFSEGRLILAGFDYSSSSPVYLSGNIEDGQSLKPLDISIGTEQSVLYGSRPVMQPLEDEYLTCDDCCFFAYDIKSGNCEELIRWGLENQYDTVFDYVCRIGEREFIAVEAGGESLIYIRAETVPAGEKSLVKVAVCADEDRWAQVQSRVEEFALANGGYEYSFTFYDGLDMSGFYTDFNSGKVPDLVLFESGLNTSSKQFDDLYKYIDADAEICREDFIPGILPALESESELRQIWTGFWMETALARVEDAAEIERQGEREYLSTAFENGDTVLLNSDSPEYVAALLTAEYVDRSSGQSNFDDESFPRFLELWSRSTDMTEKSLFFCQSIPVPLLLENVLRRDGEQWVLTGLPLCPSGGSYFRIGSAVRGAAIPVASKNKAGAWAYIKSELTMEAQLGQEYNMHVIESALEHQAAAQLSGENYQMFIEHIAATNRAILGEDEVLYDTIKRDAAAYVDGSMTLDEAAADIRSRAEIYISEQYS